LLVAKTFTVLGEQACVTLSMHASPCSCSDAAVIKSAESRDVVELGSGGMIYQLGHYAERAGIYTERCPQPVCNPNDYPANGRGPGVTGIRLLHAKLLLAGHKRLPAAR
jgi:hypothetical protein